MDDLVTTVIDSSLITAPPVGIITAVEPLQPYIRLPITGTDGSEIVQGTDRDNTILAMGGHDLIYGWNGNDDIDAGEGDDLIYGGFGSDTITGGGGSDIFRFDTFIPGEVDTIVDFRRPLIAGTLSLDLGALDTIEISARGFGGTLSPGQQPEIGVFSLPASYSGLFCFRYVDGSVSNADTLVGISTFGYNQQDGSLYYDLDGGGTAAVYQKFAQLPASANINGVIGGFIEIIS
jgi:Ca2+-binding RTX toxin-like protein